MRSTPGARLFILTTAILFIAVSWPFLAKADCDRQKLAAEAALRRHTEIMVASLLCDSYSRSFFGGQRPYALYRVFTARHSQLIGDWERQLALKAGQEQFDFWRTELANEVARADLQRASAVGTDAYCAYAKGVIETAMRLSRQEVLAFASLDGVLQGGGAGKDGPGQCR
ncbi:MAG TPA: hypothetical protein VD978_11820 [Azospirillum sp.]|nr:hypothetical protein [Azospirillum sp.]